MKSSINGETLFEDTIKPANEETIDDKTLSNRNKFKNFIDDDSKVDNSVNVFNNLSNVAYCVGIAFVTYTAMKMTGDVRWIWFILFTILGIR